MASSAQAAVYTVSWNSEPEPNGTWSATCSPGASAAVGDHSTIVGVLVDKPSIDDSVILGSERLVYDVRLSDDYNERWATTEGEWQFFVASPVGPPVDTVEFELRFDIQNPTDATQVFITNDEPELYGVPTSPAFGFIKQKTSNSADGNIIVSGGTSNEVVHSCSTVSAPVGLSAITGLMGLTLLRRRRQS
jgi:hypothetical protein